MDFDIIVIGAGPRRTKLCALYGRYRLETSALLERQKPLRDIANPAYDGREIAFTPSVTQDYDRLGHVGACGTRRHISD